MSNSPNILLFGGTTEGKATANWLSDMGFTFFYSTKTPSAFKVPEGCSKINGALTFEQMLAFCKKEHIQLVVDAAHPYADELHQNIGLCTAQLSLPSLRVERSFMAKVDDPLVTYVNTIDEMLHIVKSGNQSSVLSLMGVKSVGYLHRQLPNYKMWYRILDQPSSWELALQNGVKKEQLIASMAFKNLDDAKALVEKHQIKVLLTKDSGFNGLFDQKIELARLFRIPLIVLTRPALPLYSETIKCRADLRKYMQTHFVLPKSELAHGYTTGTCATICAKAAANYLLTGQCKKEETINLADGEMVSMLIHSSGHDKSSAWVTVIKNSGDDPDLTDGMVIGCRISYNSTKDIRFIKGEGVGTVRLPGLGLPIGEPAVNKVPRAMICSELEILKEEYELECGFDVSVFIPQGKRLGEKTFNPRLGVEGGLSVIGSTGRIKPFSAEAYIATIKRQVAVVLESNATHLIMNSGGRSERYLKKHFKYLDDYCFVQYGNYIGEALKAVSGKGIKKVSMGIMTGKAVKLAEGHLDTHSREVVMNKDFLINLAKKKHYKTGILKQVKNITMARELEKIIPFEAEEPFFNALKIHCLNVCNTVVKGFELEIILINNEGKMI